PCRTRSSISAASPRPTVWGTWTFTPSRESTSPSRGGVRRYHGSIRRRQVDADEHPRLPRPADERPVPPRDGRRRGPRRTLARAHPEPSHRIRLSEFQPAPTRERGRERRLAVVLRGIPLGRRRARAEGARAARAGGPGAQPPEPAVGRPTATGRDRAGPHQRSGDPAGGRADGKPRLADRE